MQKITLSQFCFLKSCCVITESHFEKEARAKFKASTFANDKKLTINNYEKTKKTKQIFLQKQYFAFRKSTVCHVWYSILQPLALVASKTTTILTMLPSNYGE